MQMGANVGFLRFHHSGPHLPSRSLLCALALTMGLFAAGGCTAALSDGALGHGGDGLGGEASTSTGGGPGSGGAAADDAHLRDISRLTRIEYRETVASALGVTPDVKLVPEDGRIAHFASNVGVTPDPVHPTFSWPKNSRRTWFRTCCRRVLRPTRARASMRTFAHRSSASSEADRHSGRNVLANGPAQRRHRSWRRRRARYAFHAGCGPLQPRLPLSLFGFERRRKCLGQAGR